MVWNLTKGFCRVFSVIMAGVLLATYLGQAMTGGVRIEATAAHNLDPWNAFWLLAWLVSVIITGVTKAEA